MTVFLRVWLTPREAVKLVSDDFPSEAMTFITFLGSFELILFFLPLHDFIFSAGFWGYFLLFTLAAGTTFLLIFAIAWILQVVGSWFGGEGDRDSIKPAIAVASIPLVLGLLVFILGATFSEVFQDTFQVPAESVNKVFYWIQYVLVLWAVFVLMESIDQVHRIGILRSLGTVLVTLLLLLTPAIYFQIRASEGIWNDIGFDELIQRYGFPVLIFFLYGLSSIFRKRSANLYMIRVSDKTWTVKVGGGRLMGRFGSSEEMAGYVLESFDLSKITCYVVEKTGSEKEISQQELLQLHSKSV